MLRFSKAMLAITTLVLLGLAATQTKATTVVFTDRTLFNAAAPANTTTITFGNTGATLTSSLIYTGVTFAGAPNYQVEVIEGTNIGAPGNYVLTSNSNAGQFNVDNIVITPPAGTRAFGFDLKASNSVLTGQTSAGSYEIFVNGTLAGTFTTPQGTGFSFAGFTSDVDINSITIRALTGGDPVLDNVTFGPAAPVATPEPATLVLLGTGLAGAASAARRRKRSAAAAEQA
jgi:hypothetical protein